jgi:hypothetical protein
MSNHATRGGEDLFPARMVAVLRHLRRQPRCFSSGIYYVLAYLVVQRTKEIDSYGAGRETGDVVVDWQEVGAMVIAG